ncbi:BppU family phage baseplate upper protein, partial [Enterococcus avium]|uniref:BppU family phage baseplate upper protein n=1 Tax=Enterococcus avium TaxID=33945 RepID=UPI00288EAD5D
MAYFKIVRKTLEINGSSRSTSIDLRAEVFSYDKNVSKFLFELTSKEAEIDLTGATVRVLLTYVGNDGKKGIIEDNGGVEAYTMNQIYYLLPEELRGYDGTVVMGLYVDLPSGEAIDIQNVQFRMFKSSIDDGAGVAGVVYFKSFEEWLFQVKEKALLEIQNIDDESERITEYADTKIKEYDDKFVQSNQKMSELQQSQIELSDQLNETNKKIDEADVYRKDEVFNKPESSANVIYQIIGKEKVKMTFTLDYLNK